MTKTRIRGVYKHPSGGYIARLRFRGVSTSKTFSSMASAERWMNQTKGGLETGDVVVYQGDLLSKEQAEARSRVDANHTITSLNCALQTLTTTLGVTSFIAVSI